MWYPLCKHKSHARRESFVDPRVITSVARASTSVCERWVDCLKQDLQDSWDFQDGGRPAGTGALVRALDESLRVFTRDHESLRVLDGLSEAGFAGFFGIFRMAGVPPALVRSYERWTRVCERLREITSVCECWTDCLEQDLQDLLGFSGWREVLLTHWWARTSVGREFASVYERSREFASVFVCWADCLKQDLQDFLGFSGWREDLLTQVGSDERWTRVCERLREIMSVCECLRVLGGLSGAGFAGYFGIFRMGEDLLTQVGSYERWTRVCERLREIMSVCECLRVLGGLSGAGFAGYYGDFQDGGGPADAGALGRALSEAGFAGFFGIFGMAGVPPALVRSMRLREIGMVGPYG